MHRIRQKSAKWHLSLYFIISFIFCQVLGDFTPVFASANDFSFDSFEADYYLSRDEDGTSRMKVVETFVADFPDYDQNHGITRIIPYTNLGGQNLTMESDSKLNITIKHNGIEEKSYDISSDDGYFTVMIGDADIYVHGQHTYELTYEFVNLITDQSSYQSAFQANDYMLSKGITMPPSRNWQELYWDTNGNDWLQTFGSVTVRVHLDDEIADAFQNVAWCYAGRYGNSDQDRCEITEIDDGLMFYASNLQSRENLTFDMQFDADTFSSPKAKTSYLYLIVLAIVIALIIITVVKMHQDNEKNAEKRNFYKGYPVHAEYTPYKDLTVADMGMNYIGSRGVRQLETATLIELAVTKKIRIIEDTTKKKTWKVEVLSTNIAEPQMKILKILTNGSHVNDGQIFEIEKNPYSTTLASLLENFKKTTKDRLKVRGMFEGNGDPNSAWAGLGIIYFVLLFFFFGFIGGVDKSYVNYFGQDEITMFTVFALFILAIATFVHGIRNGRIAARTMKGLEVSRYLDGMYEYIKLAEADRLNMLQSVKGADTTHQGIVKLYEKLLPYAMIFGLEKSWLNEMGKYYEYTDVEQPTWYSGTNAFAAAHFASSMSAMTRNARSNISHATYSSSSGSSSGFSGGGGGGFSGGGGGGGGGGGW